MQPIHRPTLIALTCALATTAFAQTPAPFGATTDCRALSTRTLQSDCTNTNRQTRIVALANITQPNDANEILVAIRNITDPATKIYLLQAHNTIAIATYPAELDRIEALIHQLDIPHKTYKLSFTLTDPSPTRPEPVQHFTLNLLDGQNATVKQGTKVPVLTGSFGPATDARITGAGVQTQYTYLDVGINLNATVNSTAEGGTLKFKVEQSAVAAEKSPGFPNEPIIRQTTLDGVTGLTLNKPSTIGSIDIPGTTHRFNIEVTLQQAP
jgi:type II secretory pathway component GspD/PulD (secretin)